MKLLLPLGAVLVSCALALAHEPAKEGKEGVASGLVIETSPGQNPWNHLQMRNDPKAFQFAIVTDRTGGHRPGVFEDAIKKLNLLQPEFVMSVGDLIEGYTDDTQKIDREWDEFQGFISKLDMPFFYVPGNHDYSNPAMAKAWKERFGKDYYSFVYRDVLFVCLNSQEPQMHHIGEVQAKWLEATLAANPDVRWTLVFLHSPLWEESYPKDRGWQRIENILGDRKYTVFSGHFHSYMKRIRDDHRYYTLATTGGGSGLRGMAHGEFDHVAWVTMTDAGPLVTNLLLQGIWGDDIRTPEIRELVKKAEEGAMVFVEPVILPSGAAPATVPINLIFTNPLDTPVEMSFSLVPAEGVAVRLTGLEKTDAGKYSLVLQPKAQKSLVLEATPGATYRDESLLVATVNSEAKFLTKDQIPVSLRSSSPAMIIPRRTFARRDTPPEIDGQLADWPRSEMMQVDKPAAILWNQDTWKGPKDASFAWAASMDDQFLYVAVDVTDESVQAEGGKPAWMQDGIELRVDPRPLAVRGARPDMDNVKNAILIATSPSESAKDRWIWQPEMLPEGTRSVCVRTPAGYSLEAAIPLAALEKANPKWREEGIRLNIAIDDFDGTQKAQLWWQPDWRTPRHIPGSGTIYPPKKP